MRVSDYIASFLRENGVDLVFVITGAGNVRLIEAVARAGIRYICPHHEQAAVMAALSRHRVSGKPAVCIFTGGPGAANSLLGVADAFLDSIPSIIIAGQERSDFIFPKNALRGKGVQGLEMAEITKSITKYSTCLSDPSDIKYEMEKLFHEANSGRPGPVWIDLPQDLQWANVDPSSLKGYVAEIDKPRLKDGIESAARETLNLLKTAKRPLFWIGHGIRLSGCESQFLNLLDALGVPTLVSWQAADLLPDDHPLYVGRAGTYGQRWANFALQNCDVLIALGTRLALPQRGFDDATFARNAKKVIVEIDKTELKKFDFKIDVPVLGDVKDFIHEMSLMIEGTRSGSDSVFNNQAWMQQCRDWRSRYPMVATSSTREPSADEGVNSYVFVDLLSERLRHNDIIVTDMGTSLTCTHATIRIKTGQRLITSTGLGEMGFGLPGAIGAALAAPNRRVVLLAGEGSFMMNLQELQTVQNLKLPLKIFLLNNNGYLTIKHTHNALFQSNGQASATGPETGVTFPNFSKIAEAFGFNFCRIDRQDNLADWIDSVLNHDQGIIAEIIMPEFQELIPKLALKVRADGTMYSPPLEDLYPFLPPEQLNREMSLFDQSEGI